MKRPEMVFGRISTVQTLEEVHKSNLFAQAWRNYGHHIQIHLNYHALHRGFFGIVAKQTA